MHKGLLYAAFGWLAFSGTMHFIIDVVSQFLRGERAASPETTLYYGLNTAFALGQVLFGLFGLWIAWRSIDLLGERPTVILSLAAAIGWLAITFTFMEYWEPKLNAAVFGVLVIAAAVTV